jgi:hypothetical protein
MRPLSGRHAVGGFKITTLGRGGFASRVLRVVRHERRTSLTASLGCWHAYPVGVSAMLTLAPGSSPWRLQSAHGGTPAYVTDGDGRAGMRRARSAAMRVIGNLGVHRLRRAELVIWFPAATRECAVTSLRSDKRRGVDRLPGHCRTGQGKASARRLSDRSRDRGGGQMEADRAGTSSLVLPQDSLGRGCQRRSDSAQQSMSGDHTATTCGPVACTASKCRDLV